MSLAKFPELQACLSQYFSEVDQDQDDQVIAAFRATAKPETQTQVSLQAQTLANESESLIEALGMNANRWFESAEEAKAWLLALGQKLSHSAAREDFVVKDSNGTVLQDGDSVTVIKDLKVRGGSSDLKRGTLVKKIRLISDPLNIECTVEGSTLVLKTIFLKKA